MPEPLRIFSDFEGPISTGDGPLSAWEKYVGNGDASWYTGPYYMLTDRFLGLGMKDIFRPGLFDAAQNLIGVTAHFIDRGVTSTDLIAALPKEEEFVPGIKDRIADYESSGDTFRIISTAYEPMTVFLAGQLGVPPESVTATHYPDEALSMLTPNEKTIIADVETQLSQLPDDPTEKSAQSERVILDFARAFWNPDNPALKHIQDTVDIVGGRRKTKAVRDQTTNPHRVVYIGDGVTDSHVIPSVRRWGGLSIAFNGNSTVIPGATVAIAANYADAVTPVIDAFRMGGLFAARATVAHFERKNNSNPNAQYHWIPGTSADFIQGAIIEAHADFRRQIKRPGLASLR